MPQYQPKLPKGFVGDQIILASGRLAFIGREDSILFYGNKSIGLSSAGTINADAKEKIVSDAPRIELGANADEAILLGNQTNQLLTNILQSLLTLANALSGAVNGPQGTPDLQLQIAGTALKTQLTRLKAILDQKTLLSKISFVK